MEVPFDRSVVMLLSPFDWCFQLLRSIRFLFLRLTSFWSSILDTVNRLLLRQYMCNSLWVRSVDVVVRLMDCWVSSEFSGVNALCWDSSDFWFWWDFSSMLSVLRWDLSDGELAVARTIWRRSVVGGVRSLIAFSLCWDLSDFGFWGGSLRCRDLSDFVSEVDLFVEQRSFSGDLPLALISQVVCHNCSVPGFTDGAGFRFGWMRQLLRSIRLCFW
jgi:hypothetical protein